MWTRDGKRIVITESSGSPGQQTVLGVLGSVLLAAAAVVAAFVLSARIERNFGLLALFLLLMGLIMVLSARSNRRRQYRITTVIDPDSRTIAFDKAGPEPPLVIPLSRIDRVLLSRERRRLQGGKHSSYATVYPVYLLAGDGAVLWLDTFHCLSETREQMRMLLEAVPLACSDEAGLGFHRDPVSAPGSAAEGELPPLGKSVSVTEDGSATRIRVLRRIAPDGWVLLGLIAVLFGVVPAVAGAPPTFTLVSVAIIAFILFLFLRRYEVQLTASGLEARVAFPRRGARWQVPADKLRSVRLDRYEGGVFRLRIGVAKDASPPQPVRLLFNLDANVAPPPSSERPGEEALALWETAPSARPEEGPGYVDLAHLERLIQSRYGLETQR
jgi:hypothetical protein